MMKKRILALLTLAVLLMTCTALADSHHHTLHHWEYGEEGKHIARCTECRRFFEVYCSPVTVELISGVTLPYCPVCGDLDEGTQQLAELTAEQGASVVRHGFISGSSVVRAGELDDGTLLVSVCFERYGSMAANKSDVTVKLPAGLLDGYNLYSTTGVSASALKIEGDTIRMTLAGAPAALLVFGK